MKVILLQDVRGLGKRHDIKDVRDGYAQNFLIAQKLAASANSTELARRTAQVAHEEHEVRELDLRARECAGQPLIFQVKTGEHGEMFSAINADDIVKALKEKGLEEIKKIKLEKPLRALGRHEVTVRMKYGIEAPVTIEITAIK